MQDTTSSQPDLSEEPCQQCARYAVSLVQRDEEIHKLKTINKALVEFFQYALRSTYEGGDVSGADVQDKAIALSLAEYQPYDPAKHGEAYLDPGDEFLVLTPEEGKVIPPLPNLK